VQSISESAVMVSEIETLPERAGYLNGASPQQSLSGGVAAQKTPSEIRRDILPMVVYSGCKAPGNHTCRGGGHGD